MLIVMQGPSGGGKSTKAAELAAYHNAEIFSTDDFHVEDGVYKFKPEKLSEFHLRNFERSAAAMRAGKSVIVDNTNLSAWEAKPYVEVAVELGIPVIFVRCDGGYKNLHGVPDNKVLQMRGRMEELTVEKVLASKRPF